VSEALPLFFVSAMGLSLLLYVILDGFDLGVGMLLPFGSDAEKDTMIASIGPFWDANETWIVMGVGVLLIAFPKAHGIILTALYIPVTIMLVGTDSARRGFRLSREVCRPPPAYVEQAVCIGLAHGLNGARLDARCLHHRPIRGRHQRGVLYFDLAHATGAVHHARRGVAVDQNRRRTV
jgi:hypothetical protein